MKNLKRFKTGFVTLSIFYIVLGVILIIKPEISARAICRAFGILILALGIVRVFRYFNRVEYNAPFQLDLAHGLLNVMLGIFMLISPNALVVALPVVLGMAILIDSVIRLQIAIDLRRLQFGDWMVNFILALITAIFGALLLFNPFAGSIVLTRFIGISLAIDGIVNIWVLLFVTNRFDSYNRW